MRGVRNKASSGGSTRRGLLLGAAGLAGLAAGAGRLVRPAVPAGPPVVGFHADRPYLDLTGLAAAYRPARGARGAAPLESLGEGHLSPRIWRI